jgi:soluble lytic murein transglycosylase
MKAHPHLITSEPSKGTSDTAAACLILLALGAAWPSSPAHASSAGRNEAGQVDEINWSEMLDARLNHAKELLGRTYRRTVAALENEEREYHQFLLRRVQARLPARYKHQAAVIHRVIVTESRKHGFDPAFLMAVIENESSFNPLIRGGAGEIGLMQVLPSTGQWMAEKINLRWRGERTLEDPASNIRIGSAYLAYLRGEFDYHGRLYLSAYNMGGRNVRKALQKQVVPKDYAGRVMQRYLQLYDDLRADLTQSNRALAGS